VGEQFNKSHGMSGTRLYTIWKNMKQRCYNPKRSRYKWYGAKGITVCDEWQEFIPFMQWATNNGYTEELTLDRKDSTKNYTPDNCEWVTLEENSRKAMCTLRGREVNGNIDITYKGKTQSIRAWAEESGITYKVLYNRLLKGWTMERATTQKVNSRS
jgi:hypothetical protein